MTTFQERFAAIDATATLTDAEVFDTLAGIAVTEVSKEWAEVTFLAIESSARCLVFDACGELRKWMHQVVGATALNLIAHVVGVGDFMKADTAQRNQLVSETVDAYYSRLDQLVATVLHQGTA